MILVADGDGHIVKYVPQPTPVIAQPIRTPRKKLQVKAPKLQKIEPKTSCTPNCDALAEKMPRCKTIVDNLTALDVISINDKLKRSGKIRAVKEKTKTLPRKIYFFRKRFYFAGKNVH